MEPTNLGTKSEGRDMVRLRVSMYMSSFYLYSCTLGGEV